MTQPLNIAALLPRHTDILPSKGDLDAVSRRRYQRPPVHRTARKDPKDDAWYIRYRVDQTVAPGQVKRIEQTRILGQCSEMTKRQAEKIRDQVAHEVINKPVMVLQSQVAFADVVQEYLTVLRHEVRSNSWRKYHAACGHILAGFKDSRLGDMTPQSCQMWLHGLQGKLARGTRRDVLMVFRSIWERAVDWSYTTQVFPLRKARLGPDEAGREKTLPTLEQFRKMVQIMDEPFRSVLLVATFTGLRISEIRGLQWGDVEGDSIRIRRSRDLWGDVHQPKTATSARIVPVGHLKTIFIYGTGSQVGKRVPLLQASEPVTPKQVARERRVPEEPLQQQRAEPMTSEDPSRQFIFPFSYKVLQTRLKAAAKAVGIEYAGFGWHTFRRASVTWGKRAGASQGDSMAQHGHAGEAVNDAYYVEDDEDFKRRAEAEARLMEVVMFGGKGGRA